MNNFTRMGRSLLLAFCFISLFGANLTAQSCNFNANSISVSVNDVCLDSDPFVTVNLNNFFLDGEAVIRYEPVYNGFFQISGVDYTASVDFVAGFGTFEIAEPRIPGFPNNFVRITEISFTGLCSQTFTGNELVSNSYNYNGTSDITFSNLNTVEPPCPGVPTGNIQFFFAPGTPNGLGFNNFNRFQVRQQPFLSSAFTTLNPPGTGGNNTADFEVVTQGLVSGTYVFLIQDNQTGCETSYTVSIGGNFSVDAMVVEEAGCFGESNGEIEISVVDADPNSNGPISYGLVGDNGISRTGVITASFASGSLAYDPVIEGTLPAGTYTIAIQTSAGGCNDQTGVVVTELDEITVDPIDPIAVCADDATYTITISGVENANRYRIRDAGTTGCWTNAGSLPLPMADENGVITITETLPSSCFNIAEDSTVSVNLRLINTVESPTCNVDFPFTVQVNAMPAAPVVQAYAIPSAGDTIVTRVCSGDDVEIFVEDYDADFSYELTLSGTSGANIDTLGAFAGGTAFYTGPGSVIGSFVNNNNGNRTIDFSMTKTNNATGCVSDQTDFSMVIRPLPVVDPFNVPSETICSDEIWTSEAITLNGGNNSNITYNYEWVLNSPNLFLFSTSTGSGNSGDPVSARFGNTSGQPLSATLIVTPVFNQGSPLIGGGSLTNNCEGAPQTIELTISPQPILTYGLTIGDEATVTLTSGDVLSREICTGDDFSLENLLIAEDGSPKADFVEFRVNGDAGFLNIVSTPFVTYLPVDNFSIGVQDIMNNNPNNNAQVAEIILTPYFEDGVGTPGTDFPTCAGDPITLFLTVNPAVPQIADQATMVCSGDRIEYQIAGASNMNGALETRITGVELFEGTTDYVIPVGAARVDSFQFFLYGADGGGATGSGFSGGRGAYVEGTLNDLQILPGDTVRVREGLAGASNVTNGNGGDATIMSVIRPGSGEVFTFVAGGGAGAGNAMNGETANGSTLGGSGLPGIGPGGEPGTDLAGGALGGVGINLGGGGGGGFAGGDGGDSPGGFAGGAGSSDVDGVGTAFVANKTAMDINGDARIFFTIVYDDIRFNLDERIVAAGLIETTEPGQEIMDGEIDTILFGQQFENPTNEPLDVIYRFITNTEAVCDDGGMVEIIVTVEPEPRGEITGDGTSVAGDAASGFTATVCSGDGLDALLSSPTNPVNGPGSVYFLVDTEVTPNNGQVGFFGPSQGTAHTLQGTQYFLTTTELPFFESGIFNNSMGDATITYTITPYINCIQPSLPDCEGTPFTFTVTVQPGFSGVSNVADDVCSKSSLADAGFEFANSQPGANIAFTAIRVLDFQTNTSSADFDTVSTVLPAVIPTEGVLLTDATDYFDNDTYRNRTGADVTVTYTVALVSADGCESLPLTYTFTVQPEPIIDDSNAELTVCSDELLGLQVLYANNSATVASIDYFVTAEAGLVFTGTGNGAAPTLDASASIMADDAWENTTTTSLDVTYRVVLESIDGCLSDTVDYVVTVEPEAVLTLTASQGATQIAGAPTVGAAPTITICSGTSVDFALSQSLTDDTGVSYRIIRNTDNAPDVTDGNGNALDNAEGGLEVADFTEELINNGNTAQQVLYSLRAYTYGRNGEDNNGGGGTDDCQGPVTRVFVEVLPAITDASALTFNYFVDGSFDSNTPVTDTVCSFTDISIRPGTTIDPATGVAFTWEQTNDGGLPTDSGFGGFNFQQGNTFFVNPSERIEASLENPNVDGVTFTYDIQLYTFGSNGIDDQLAPGSDDCPGAMRTITVFVEPTPTLSADIVVGSSSETLMPSNELQLFELCSGDDFSLGNLTFGTNDVPGRAKYVLFSINGLGVEQQEFLGIAPNGPGVEVDASGFLIGSQNVQNTSGDAYVAFISLTPYYEDDTNSPNINGDCAGESIDIVVILNPEVTGVPSPQDLTVCSGETVDYAISGGANGLTSFTTGSYDFADGTDFVFPDNASSIPFITFSASSANGGGSTTNGLAGAPGVKSEGALNFFGGSVIPGDTLRAVLGQPGADGLLAGNGGGASSLSVIGGPNRGNQEGLVISQLVLGGGGGAGLLEAATNPVDMSGGVAEDGDPGAGPGGFPGLSAPTFGGGDARNNGGGGGGGWIGGDGGDSFTGQAGASGTGLISGPIFVDFVDPKNNMDDAGSSITINFALELDDVIFTVVDKVLPTDPDFDSSGAPLAVGDSGLDTLLNGETFVNDSDVPQVVTYTLSTGTETGCPGSTIDVNVTVEPNPTITLASNGTTIMGDAETGYTATICSGDSLSAILSSNTMPSVGNGRVRARVISAVESNPADVSFTNTNTANASALNNFGGNNQVAVADIPFYEGAINNISDVAETVTYTVVTLINNQGSPNCTGDTITLTVTVEPGFDGVVNNPAQVSLCSNISLDDAGFDFDATQPSLQIGFDSVMIDSVRTSLAVADPNFETVNSAFSGSPVIVTRSGGFLGDETYRNRTGGPVIVTYYVRLVSAAGCLSDEIVYNFRYTAEPVIDIVESTVTGNVIDTTVCDGQAIDLEVLLASNSAWFTNQSNVVHNITRELPAGLDEVSVATYPATGVAANYFAADEYSNDTNEPLTVTYTVTPLNGSCEGDAVTYSATILPNPQAELTLTSMDSTASFSLENSRAFLDPDPVFGVCSGQPLTVEVTDQSNPDVGTLMANVTITDLDNVVAGAASSINFIARVADLGDSLSFAADELVNLSGMVDTFTISYFTFFNRNGIAGNQGVVNGDCGSNGTVEFDVVVTPVNSAFSVARLASDNSAIAAGDSLCAGTVYDLIVRAATNDNTLPAIDSFLVEVDAPAGLVAVGGTEGADFWVTNLVDNVSVLDFSRIEDQAFNNTTPGVKQVTYIVTPYSNNCPGIPDTVEVSIRPDILLKLDEPALCIQSSSQVFPITAVDQNQATSQDRFDYSQWRYTGGTAHTFSISRNNGSETVFVNQNQGTTGSWDDTQFLRVEVFSNTGAGTVNLELDYENEFGCTITEMFTLTITSDAAAGEFDMNVPVECEDNTPILLEDYLDNFDPGGTWSRTTGPALGTFNAGAGTFVANNLNGGGAELEFGFRYIIGDGNAGCEPDTADIIVVVQSVISAGTYVGTPLEACNAATPVNLFDALIGEETGGIFVQLSGMDNVVVDGNDGTFDQTGVAPGTYTYRYEVAGRNNCPGDDETVVVEVLSQADCSEPVPCDVITLNAGFNVISFDVIPNDNDVRAIFADEIASRNLLDVVGIQASVANGLPEEFGYVSLLDDYLGNITNGIQGGYGYIVNVQNATTIEVCGTAVDEDFRPELVDGFNLVGYTPQASIPVDTFFQELIENNNLDLVRTVIDGLRRERIYNFAPFPIGNLLNVDNGFGYLLDVNMAFGENTWRSVNDFTTSTNFNRFHGFVAGGEELVGETFEFTNAEGKTFGFVTIREGGIYFGGYAFGDIKGTDEQEGFSPEEEIFVTYNGVQYATDVIFADMWDSRRLDVDFSSLVSSDEEVVPVAEGIKVYPNPTADISQVEIKLDRAEAKVILEVYNGLGQVIVSRVVEGMVPGQQTVNVDFSEFPAGTYQLRVFTAERLIGHQQVIRR